MADLDDREPSPFWRVGDVARCYTASVGIVDVPVTEANVWELNAGENPLYPWHLLRVERWEVSDVAT